MEARFVIGWILTESAHFTLKGGVEFGFTMKFKVQAFKFNKAFVKVDDFPFDYAFGASTEVGSSIRWNTTFSSFCPNHYIYWCSDLGGNFEKTAPTH